MPEYDFTTGYTERIDRWTIFASSILPGTVEVSGPISDTELGPVLDIDRSGLIKVSVPPGINTGSADTLAWDRDGFFTYPVPVLVLEAALRVWHASQAAYFKK